MSITVKDAIHGQVCTKHRSRPAKKHVDFGDGSAASHCDECHALFQTAHELVERYEPKADAEPAVEDVAQPEVVASDTGLEDDPDKTDVAPVQSDDASLREVVADAIENTEAGVITGSPDKTETPPE